MDHDPEIINVENHQPRGEQCHYKWPQQLHVKGPCRLFNTWNYLHNALICMRCVHLLTPRPTV